MTDIMQALGALSHALDDLERAAHERIQAEATGAQQSLFDGLPEPAAIAKKLDGAIQRVQQVLQEG